jgi:hypothetical protein
MEFMLDLWAKLELSALLVPCHKPVRRWTHALVACTRSIMDYLTKCIDFIAIPHASHSVHPVILHHDI